MSTEQDQRSGLEKALGIISEVKAGEGVTVLLMTFNILFLLTAYYMIKPVREGLILAIDGGKEYKSYLAGGIAVVLLGAVPAYGAIAKKLPKHKLVVGVTMFFVSHLLIWRLLSAIESTKSWLGLVFFVWVGVFNMMVVAQFWAFGADIYTEDQGKRLFPVMGVGASLGAVIGSFVTKMLVKAVGNYSMLLVSGAVLSTCAVLTLVVHRREVARKAGEASPKVNASLKNTMAATPDMEAELDKIRKKGKAKLATAKPVKEAGGTFSMVFRYRYLILLAAFGLIFTTANSNGEYILGSIIVDTAKEEIAAGGVSVDLGVLISEKFANFFLYVNILSVFLATFVVSRVVKLGGVKWAFLVFPAIALLDAAALSIAPVMLTLQIFKTGENAADYSFNNTSRNMLWLPTTRAMKYGAKQAVDTFFIRMGDVAAALVVFILAGTLHLGVRAFAFTNIVLGFIVIFICLMILREQKVLIAMKERGELPEDEEEPA